MYVMVCVFIGVVVYNIFGYIFYVVFFFLLNVKSSDDYIFLLGERFVILKEFIGNFKVWIIDEIFMVGLDMFFMVYCRLCDVMGNY